MKKAAVINDLSGFGKCSLTAALPTLSAMGIQCVPLATAVLTGQTGYEYYHCTDLTDMIPQYTDAWVRNKVEFDAICTGYMTGPVQVEKVLDFISKLKTPDTLVVVDPVMGDDGRTYGIYTDALLSGMREIVRQANLITPNLTEAALLAGYSLDRIYSNSDNSEKLKIAEEIGYILKEQGNVVKDVVITGIKCHDSESSYIYNLAFSENGMEESKSHLFNRSFSGTGDLFTSIMCGSLLNGLNTVEGMKLASSFLYNCIADTMNEDVPGNDGINFEPHLIDLIKGGR